MPEHVFPGRFAPIQVGFLHNRPQDRQWYVVPITFTATLSALDECNRDRSRLPPLNVIYFHNFWTLLTIPSLVIGRNVRFEGNIRFGRKVSFGTNVCLVVNSEHHSFLWM